MRESNKKITVTFPHPKVEPTKPGVLQKISSCYNSVGLATSTLLVRKLFEIAVNLEYLENQKKKQNK